MFPTRSSRRIDAKVSALINDVQAYSKPEGQYPTPPIDTSSAGLPFTDPAPPDLTGPDRLRPPDWFEPYDRKDDEVPACFKPQWPKLNFAVA